MNHFFYESRGKEKVQDLMKEGMRSQEVHRSSAPSLDLRRSLLKLIMALVGILGILGWLVR
jgi:hypothetical protein